MATVASESKNYPTSDGRPMAETDLHRKLMFRLIQRLDTWFAADNMLYVSGNLLLFYERGNKRKHLAPDVFVVKGVAKGDRQNYLLWEEGKGPDVVVEVTSSSTRKEDSKEKFELYQDVLKVAEYFLFDPLGDYLKPPLQGYRLVEGAYQAIAPDRGVFRSEELGLLLQRDGSDLRLYDPASRQWLLAPDEDLPQQIRARLKAEQARLEAEHARLQAEQARLEAVKALQETKAEIEELRRQIDALRRESK